MIGIPLQINRDRFLVLILQKENLVRLQNADPIDLNTKKYFIPSNLGDVQLLIAYESDDEKLKQFAESGDVQGLIKWLERGRTVYDGESIEPSPFMKDKK